MHCTNLIELASIELDEATNPTWIQAMPLGLYHHPKYGPINFSAETLADYANGVNGRIRDAELDIDYDHKKYHGGASGWIKQAEVREGNGLWVLVEWTKTALQEIKEKKYRYFSPEFVDKWIHPKTKMEHKNVLLGGAITNRPFLRDIATLNLTESQSEELMLEELRKLLGMPEDADEAAILAKVQESVTAGAENEAPTDPPAPKPIQPAPIQPAQAPVAVAATETQPADDPIIRQMSERVAQLELALRMSETDKLVKALNDAGEDKGWAIAPVMLEEVKTLMLESPTDAYCSKLYSLFERITKDGLIQLGEIGHDTDHGNVSATKQFSDLVEAAKAKNPDANIGDLMEKVAAEHPEAWEAHRRSTLMGGVK